MVSLDFAELPVLMVSEHLPDCGPAEVLGIAGEEGSR